MAEGLKGLCPDKDSQKACFAALSEKKSHILSENFGDSKEDLIFAPRNSNGGFI